MSWRAVVITSRCKLDYKMGFMVVRAEETKKIFLDEIAILLIENPAVSLTGRLLEALTEKKIRVIFHDNMFNHFNLSCDLMEPFRILIESSARAYLKFTKRCVIDSDLCVF